MPLTDYKKIKRNYATTEAGLTLISRQWGHAEDTGRIVVMRSDGVTKDYFWNSARLASTSASYGSSLIGSIGINGITPNGGSQGAAATLQNMLTGMAASVVLKAPYSSTANLISIAGDFIGLRVRCYGSQTNDLQRWEAVDGTAMAYIDYLGQPTFQNSVNAAYGLTLANGNNTNAGAHASIALSVGGTSAGDAKIGFFTTGSSAWSIGSDNSDSRKFKISQSSNLGTNDYLTIDTAGVAAFSNNVFTSLAGGGYWIDPTISSFTYGMYKTGTSLAFRSGSTSPYLTVNSSGQPTFANAVTITGLLTATGGILPGLGAGGAGTIIASNSNGLKIQGATGSVYDFSVFSQSGSAIIVNPTGTTSVTLPSGDLTISRANVGGVVFAKVENTDNTSAASHAGMTIKSGGGSAGDAYINFAVASATDWIIGVDNSDSDKFKISKSTALGTNDALSIATTGDITIGAGLSITGSMYFTSLSSGRIPVLGFSGQLTQDNLYWDATNDRVGIGANASSPTADLTISKTTNAGSVYAYIINSGTGAGTEATLWLSASSGDFAKVIMTGSSSYCLGSGSLEFNICQGTDLASNKIITIGASQLTTIFKSLDVQGNYLKLPVRSTDPSSPVAGWMYYNSTGNHGRLYNGTSWIEFG